MSWATVPPIYPAPPVTRIRKTWSPGFRMLWNYVYEKWCLRVNQQMRAEEFFFRLGQPGTDRTPSKQVKQPPRTPRLPVKNLPEVLPGHSKRYPLFGAAIIMRAIAITILLLM